MAISTRIRTPPVPSVVPAGVFDAFGWCESDWLHWQRPEGAVDWETPINGADPARMVFVLHEECAFLPTELARLHAFGLGLDSERALAPYAIDEATDELYARRVRPRSLMWLAADNLNALYWGLHDWAHFHNHGPFVERAWTELQCDVAALRWMTINHEAIGLPDQVLDRARREVAGLVAGRFAAEGLTVPAWPTWMID